MRDRDPKHHFMLAIGLPRATEEDEDGESNGGVALFSAIERRLRDGDEATISCALGIAHCLEKAAKAAAKGDAKNVSRWMAGCADFCETAEDGEDKEQLS